MEHKEAFRRTPEGQELRGELFQANFEVLLYDLTSTYFEGLMEDVPKAKRGYSRDHRPGCKQLVIALIITLMGFRCRTRSSMELAGCSEPGKMIGRVETKYGKAHRTWVFDRGVVSEENLAQLRQRGGTCGGNPSFADERFRSGSSEADWQQVRGSQVKLRPGTDGDLYVIARSAKRRAKENAMRRKPMRKLYIDSLKGLDASMKRPSEGYDA